MIISRILNHPFPHSSLNLTSPISHYSGLKLQVSVIVPGEAPHDVGRGRLLHVLLQVVEGVLGHVGQAQALRLPDGTLRGEPDGAARTVM